MKSSILGVGIIACILSAPIVSAEDKSPPAKPAMNAQMDKQMSQMQENMKLMQKQMDELRATTDPKKREALMQGHMQTMQANMTMMRGMDGAMMMGGSQCSAMASGGHQDMMQMMMDQMMQHGQMMQHDQMKQPTPDK
jgi:hypothetical protein